MQTSMRKSQRRLAALWFSGGGLVFFILLLQSFMGHYGEGLTKGWGWFLPTIMPTLSLIVGVLVAGASEKQQREKSIDRFLYRLAFFLSLVYLVVVLLTILIQPLSAMSAPLLMKQSHLWLAPFQGLVSASLGVFFTQTRTTERKARIRAMA